MQSVPITSSIVSLNPAHVELFLMQHYVIKFVSDLRKVDGFITLFITNPVAARSGLIANMTSVSSHPYINPIINPVRNPDVHCKHVELFLMQHYVIKFVSDLRKVDGFLQ
jgi:hypothetical protein